MVARSAAIPLLHGGTEVTIKEITDMAAADAATAIAAASTTDASAIATAIAAAAAADVTSDAAAIAAALAARTSQFSIAWSPGTNPNNGIVMVADAHTTVTGVKGRIETAEGAAGTVTPVIAPSGTAVSAGTTLTTAGLDVNGTPAINQTLTLGATVTLAAGDALGLITSGSFSKNTGILTFTVTKP